MVSKWIKGVVLAAVLLVAAGLLAVFVTLRASLPRVEGEVRLAGLSGQVTVSRDALGIPVVVGQTLQDVVTAQGFLHAQERFFQMDLARRYVAGELAELVGPVALSTDEEMRVFRQRKLAARILASLTAGQRRLLEAYTVGVNAGLDNLGARPPEYWALGTGPASWAPEDTVLVSQYFFIMLSLNRRIEPSLGVMQQTLAPELYAFLTPDTTRFDAPLIRPAAGDEVGGYRPLPIPGPDVIDLRISKPVRPKHDVVWSFGDPWGGSNNWAVAGRRSKHRGAILANDPHLPLAVPGIWYRIELKWGDHLARGVSAPGLPGVVIGANNHLAWGFTNGMGDHDDFIVIEVHPDDPSRYLTPDGYQPFDEITEVIKVRGGPSVELPIRQTRWGPVTHEDPFGRPLVLKSTSDDPASVNLNLNDLVLSETLEEAVQVARRWYSAAQNVLLADTNGRIAWVVSGYFPNRVGFDGKAPVSWADGRARWEGALDESLRPVLIDPPEGILFTANNRTVPTTVARRITQAWAPPTRAGRIAELLRGGDQFDERDFLAMQLDTRSALHDMTRDIVLAVVTQKESDPALRQARAIVESWNGTAGADQPAFRILREYQGALREALIAPMLGPCLKVEEDFQYIWGNVDEPVARLLEERPRHLLPPDHETWEDLLRDVLSETLERIGGNGSNSGLDAPWGESNRAAIGHPLARAVPLLGALMNMPRDPMPGHVSTLRVHFPGFGASMRMVVSPGREEDGILHMPCGQSGHLLSPHYDDGHDAWVKGSPSPFLAGPTESALTFVPKS